MKQRNQGDSTLSVLFADDDALLQELALIGLEDMGHVWTAGTGLEVLDLLVRFQPDVLILDILFPDMDAYEILSRIQSSKVFCHPRILITSGLPATQPVVQRLKKEFGISAYFTKPYDFVSLRKAILEGSP